MQTNRIPLLVIVVAVVAVIVLLVSSLPSLSYNTAELNFDLFAPASQNDETETVDATEPEPFAVPPVLVSVFLWLAVGMVVFYILSSPETRARLRRQILAGISLSLTIYVLLRFVLPALLVPQEMPAGNSPNGLSIVVPTNPLLIYGTSTAIAALIVGGVWFAVIMLQKRRHPLDAVARSAEDALADLESGKNVRETIMRCYIEMSNAVGQTHNMRRQAAMTPREFQERLERAGLPARQTQRLTGLFEKVRYGGHQAGEAEIREARDCLTDILFACERQ